MSWYEWLIISLVWMLIPVALIIKTKQEERFRRWQKEDQKNINNYIRGLNEKQ